MIERLMIPLDGSAAAEAVLPQVGRLLRRSDAEVLLVRAVDPPMTENAPFLLDPLVSMAKTYVNQLAWRLSGEGVRARGIVRVGNPAWVLTDTAEEEHVSLIAMSTHGRTGLSRFVFGSVAEKILRSSPVPVLVLRSHETGPAGQAVPVKPVERPIRKILVPTDGSELSLEAMAYAEEMAALFGAGIVTLRVLEEAEQPWVLAGTILRWGDPASEILNYAANEGVDLIVMSTHGRSGLSRWVFGSVTEKVLRAADLPILVVRRTMAASATAPAAEGERRAP